MYNFAPCCESYALAPLAEELGIVRGGGESPQNEGQTVSNFLREDLDKQNAVGLWGSRRKSYLVNSYTGTTQMSPPPNPVVCESMEDDSSTENCTLYPLFMIIRWYKN